MELIKFTDYIKLDEFQELSVALGEFDGLHLGHIKVIESMINDSIRLNTKKAIITFSPHPKYVLNNDKFTNLTNDSQRDILLSKYNIDYLIVIDFTKEFANINGKDFVEKYLDKINVKSVSIGFDFKFGINGSSKAEDIKNYSNNDIIVNIVKEVTINNIKVSSTSIRNFLLNGNVVLANELLGYNFSFSGIVIHGRHIGSTISLPTANVSPSKSLFIKKGVYAVKITIDNEIFNGMMNVGINPSFNRVDYISYEVNIFSFNKNIYDKEVVVTLFDFIREEMKFDSIESFLNQVEKDKKRIRSILQIS